MLTHCHVPNMISYVFLLCLQITYLAKFNRAPKGEEFTKKHEKHQEECKKKRGEKMLVRGRGSGSGSGSDNRKIDSTETNIPHSPPAETYSMSRCPVCGSFYKSPHAWQQKNSRHIPAS